MKFRLPTRSCTNSTEGKGIGPVQGTEGGRTAEFKLADVQLIKDGQRFAVVARELGMSEHMLRNWVRSKQAGKLHGQERSRSR